MPLDLAKIKKLMYQQGITQNQLASSLKVSVGSIYRKLNGFQEFKANQVGAIADLLKVKTDDLYFHEIAKKEGIF